MLRQPLKELDSSICALVKKWCDESPTKHDEVIAKNIAKLLRERDTLTFKSVNFQDIQFNSDNLPVLAIKSRASSVLEFFFDNGFTEFANEVNSPPILSVLLPEILMNEAIALMIVRRMTLSDQVICDWLYRIPDESFDFPFINTVLKRLLIMVDERDIDLNSVWSEKQQNNVGKALLRKRFREITVPLIKRGFYQPTVDFNPVRFAMIDGNDEELVLLLIQNINFQVYENVPTKTQQIKLHPSKIYKETLISKDNEAKRKFLAETILLSVQYDYKECANELLLIAQLLSIDLKLQDLTFPEKLDPIDQKLMEQLLTVGCRGQFLEGAKPDYSDAKLWISFKGTQVRNAVLVLSDPYLSAFKIYLDQHGITLKVMLIRILIEACIADDAVVVASVRKIVEQERIAIPALDEIEKNNVNAIAQFLLENLSPIHIKQPLTLLWRLCEFDRRAIVLSVIQHDLFVVDACKLRKCIRLMLMGDVAGYESALTVLLQKAAADPNFCFHYGNSAKDLAHDLRLIDEPFMLALTYGHEELFLKMMRHKNFIKTFPTNQLENLIYLAIKKQLPILANEAFKIAKERQVSLQWSQWSDAKKANLCFKRILKFEATVAALYLEHCGSLMCNDVGVAVAEPTIIEYAKRHWLAPNAKLSDHFGRIILTTTVSLENKLQLSFLYRLLSGTDMLEFINDYPADIFNATMVALFIEFFHAQDCRYLPHVHYLQIYDRLQDSQVRAQFIAALQKKVKSELENLSVDNEFAINSICKQIISCIPEQEQASIIDFLAIVANSMRKKGFASVAESHLYQLKHAGHYELATKSRRALVNILPENINTLSKDDSDFKLRIKWASGILNELSTEELQDLHAGNPRFLLSLVRLMVLDTETKPNEKLISKLLALTTDDGALILFFENQRSLSKEHIAYLFAEKLPSLRKCILANLSLTIVPRILLGFFGKSDIEFENSVLKKIEELSPETKTYYDVHLETKLIAKLLALPAGLAAIKRRQDSLKGSWILRYAKIILRNYATAHYRDGKVAMDIWHNADKFPSLKEDLFAVQLLEREWFIDQATIASACVRYKDVVMKLILDSKIDDNICKKIVESLLIPLKYMNHHQQNLPEFKTLCDDIVLVIRKKSFLKCWSEYLPLASLLTWFKWPYSYRYDRKVHNKYDQQWGEIIENNASITLLDCAQTFLKPYCNRTRMLFFQSRVECLYVLCASLRVVRDKKLSVEKLSEALPGIFEAALAQSEEKADCINVILYLQYRLKDAIKFSKLPVIQPLQSRNNIESVSDTAQQLENKSIIKK